MSEDTAQKNNEKQQPDINPDHPAAPLPEIYMYANSPENQAIDPSQTSRIFLYKKEAPPETPKEAASKKLQIEGLSGINVTIKSVSGGRAQQDSSSTPHFKKHEYVPEEARKITPEEKEKHRLEELAKVRKIQKEETRKAMARKGSRELVEKGILTKVIVAGGILLGLLAILLYFLKS